MEILIPSITDAEKILALSKKYLLYNLNEKDCEKGFIRIAYSKEDIEQIILQKEIVIARDNEKVIGYYLIGKSSNNPALEYQKIKAEALAEKKQIPFNKIGYGCQVCIEEPYRSNGVSKLMIAELQKIIASKYDYLLSTISSNNKASLQNSTKIGWQPIGENESPMFYLFKVI